VTHFSDALAESIMCRRSVVCVGLDPDLSQFPPALLEGVRPTEEEMAACAGAYCRAIVHAVADFVAVAKPQAAFFEQFGPSGWAALRDVVRCAREHGLPVILDAKRGDIASTGKAYARALFGGATVPGSEVSAPGLEADAVTVSPYLGEDSVTPFTEYCDRGKGVFVLTRTSNPGAASLQERDLEGRPLYVAVAELVAELGARSMGRHGYSDVGAVAGATAPEAVQRVRRVVPRAFLLVPGYGAQGGSAADIAGLAVGPAAGLVVNASRSIMYAWRAAGGDYQVAAAEAARAMRDDLVGVLGR
jgi:orotidine-5'-phosphate decarboxylase